MDTKVQLREQAKSDIKEDIIWDLKKNAKGKIKRNVKGKEGEEKGKARFREVNIQRKKLEKVKKMESGY